MMQSIYTALSGMSAQQYTMDVIGDNLANINTMAFKSGRADFADALYEQMQKPVGAGNYLQKGSGVLVNAVQRDNSMGEYVSTGSPLDFMLDGSGYFAVQGPQGACYTRDGSFKVSVKNGTNYLVTPDGDYVLGADNKPITVPGNADQISCDNKGNLSLGGTQFASLKIVSFANPSGLADMGSSKFLPTAASGAVTASTAMVRQGWEEGSNVNMAAEMARLLVAQRAYSVLGNAVRTADEMDSEANSMSK
jgi:flagellar basal-body rod protein FlgG